MIRNRRSVRSSNDGGLVSVVRIRYLGCSYNFSSENCFSFRVRLSRLFFRDLSLWGEGVNKKWGTVVN